MRGSLGVIGGGFGLYGYAIAAINLGMEVVTLQRYSERIQSRSDTSPLFEKFTFVNTEREIVDRELSGIVVARNPLRQVEFIREYLHVSDSHWFLEKPLTPTLGERNEIQRLLSERAGTFSVGYLFPFTSWFQQVVERVNGSDSVTNVNIDWSLSQINARWGTPNWKAEPAQGGGLLSFYAIHLSPLFLSAGISEIKASGDSVKELLVSGTVPGGGHFSARVSAGEPHFHVEVEANNSKWTWTEETPFGASPSASSQDMRVGILETYIATTLKDPQTAMQRGISYECGASDLLAVPVAKSSHS